jgi:hypothetical protein
MVSIQERLSQTQLQWRFDLITFDRWQLEQVQTTFDQVFRDFQTVGLESADLDIEDRAWLHLVCYHAEKHFRDLQTIAQLKLLPGYFQEDDRHYYRDVQHYALHAYQPSETYAFDRLCLDFLTRLYCPPNKIQQLAERYEADYNLLVWQTWDLRSHSSWQDRPRQSDWVAA